MGAKRPTGYDFERPWIRQPCDTEARWRAFLAYRDQPPPRTISGAIEALGGANRRKLEMWSSEDAWPERCATYDRWLDEHRTQVIADVLAEDARAVANRHAAIARDAIECAHSVVRRWVDDLAKGYQLEPWSPSEVRAMLRDMITLERLVRGEATERVEHGLSGIDLSKLSIGELEDLRRLEAKAGAGVLE
jgi:hypothetical protein